MWLYIMIATWLYVVSGNCVYIDYNYYNVEGNPILCGMFCYGKLRIYKL